MRGEEKLEIDAKCFNHLLHSHEPNDYSSLAGNDIFINDA